MRKASATGRIIIWRGGSLWIGQAGEPAGMHAHHALQISLPFDGSVRFQLPRKPWKSYAAVIVAAEQPHAFEARGRFMAQIFLEPESRDGRVLQLEHQTSGLTAIRADKLKAEIAALAAAFRAKASNDNLVGLTNNVIRKLVGAAAAPATAPDARIAKAIELIRERLGGAIPLKSIAAAVHLSPDRFRHLFMQETGVAFRPYLLWQRLDSALVAYVKGASLTEAAHDAGFSDAAHFTRTFRKMFGITPASVRPE